MVVCNWTLIELAFYIWYVKYGLSIRFMVMYICYCIYGIVCVAFDLWSYIHRLVVTAFYVDGLIDVYAIGSMLD